MISEMDHATHNREVCEKSRLGSFQITTILEMLEASVTFEERSFAGGVTLGVAATGLGTVADGAFASGHLDLLNEKTIVIIRGRYRLLGPIRIAPEKVM